MHGYTCLFPKAHKSFADDPVILRAIAHVEDSIELRYQALSIKNALKPIISFFAKPISMHPKIPMSPELLAALENLAAIPISHAGSQLDVDREAIWDIKARCGSLYVVGFLEPELLTSLEIIFSGIVIGYIQMFNDSKTRLRLHPSRVFKDLPDLNKFHVEVVQPLRDIQYAHKSSAEGQQSLTYAVNEAGDILINLNPPHIGFEFYHGNYEKLYQCAREVVNYLDGEISRASEKLLSRLNEEQIVALRSEWEKPSHMREVVDPMTLRKPKAKIPKNRNDE